MSHTHHPMPLELAVKEHGVLGLIGRTPLVELEKLSPNPRVRIFAKLEGQNPTGSIKDRIVLHMLSHAEEEGLIAPGDRIVEASTGNTGIALAMIGNAAGYRATIVMPRNVYPEIPEILHAYGATIIWTEMEQGVHGAIGSARRLAGEHGVFFLDQFGNDYNVQTHYLATGPEIYHDLPEIDVLVAGLGTGGTIMGIGRYLKERLPGIRLIAVEPHPGAQVQGLKSLADGFIPPILEPTFIDGKILVRAASAFKGVRLLMHHEGIFGGVSSGATLQAALRVARGMREGNIVVIFADGGWKYLRSRVFGRIEMEPAEAEQVDDTIWW
ncbi:MAG: pyridoxal-phosphate dependent enzyme [Dehalococcoidia bacterium]|nr:pyridoxal-phosphate dependent enzyme [Dehalococcoidia bacterium]